MSGLSVSALKMPFDFFERFSFRLRQDKRCGDKINDCAAGENKKHRGIAVLPNCRQKDPGDGGGDRNVDKQGNAHAFGTDPGGHEFGKREPDADARSDGEECHETINQDGGPPTAVQSPRHPQTPPPSNPMVERVLWLRTWSMTRPRRAAPR